MQFKKNKTRETSLPNCKNYYALIMTGVGRGINIQITGTKYRIQK